MFVRRYRCYAFLLLRSVVARDDSVQDEAETLNEEDSGSRSEDEANDPLFDERFNKFMHEFGLILQPDSGNGAERTRFIDLLVSSS